jgi:hypothetical protein
MACVVVVVLACVREYGLALLGSQRQRLTARQYVCPGALLRRGGEQNLPLVFSPLLTL